MSQPLAGRTVVVTRAASQAGAFITALESYGASVISCPTIEIADPESYDRLDEAIDHLSRAEELGNPEDDMWDPVLGDLTAEQRREARIYRLNE